MKFCGLNGLPFCSLYYSWSALGRLSCGSASNRTEYLARINNESRLKFEIQTLTQALEQEKHNAALAIAQTQQALKNKPKEKDSKPVVLDTDSLSLNIQFYDPKQLLDSVNKTVSVPYFNLCQIFLNKATELCIQHYKLNSTDICTVHKFDEKVPVSVLRQTSQMPSPV